MADDKNNEKDISSVRVSCIPKHFIKKKLNSLLKVADEQIKKHEDEKLNEILGRVNKVTRGEEETFTLNKDEFEALKEYTIGLTVQNIAGGLFEWVRVEEGMSVDINLHNNTDLDGILEMFGLKPDDVNITKCDKEDNNDNKN